MNAISEEKVDNQEPICVARKTTENSPSKCIENVQDLHSPSPLTKKSIDEDVNAQNLEGLTDLNSVQYDQSQPAKTEKGAVEEGFCCVMSMHDGVVLYVLFHRKY